MLPLVCFLTLRLLPAAFRTFGEKGVAVGHEERAVLILPRRGFEGPIVRGHRGHPIPGTPLKTWRQYQPTDETSTRNGAKPADSGPFTLPGNFRTSAGIIDSPPSSSSSPSFLDRYGSFSSLDQPNFPLFSLPLPAEARMPRRFKKDWIRRIGKIKCESVSFQYVVFFSP